MQRQADMVMTMTTLSRLTEIIEDVIDDHSVLFADTERDWDSITQIQVIYAMENEFSLKLSIADIEAFNQLVTIGQMQDWIDTRKMH